ncbi:related to Cyclophilin-16 [Ustilago trichophora]|uniref:Related to Cyclophilin-16 n=1 Tax=Ustilago trichophora TaxID=86804 RepID=A0A5C3EIS3_9BASI|nr:related to Cyclophilin-16 [Ustilago trichophora]
MTSQYVTEPPTSGLVELSTSKGPILIELFSRECPLACRNFLTLALEGFYDNLLFHRLIPGFIIQSGDPSATGTGGESTYGEPFAIEPHSRLKFNRRGLLAMAAEDKQNESQFFLTLDATPELQGKHTLMGRVVGKSIYTLLELTEGVELVGEGGDRPRYPPKLKEVKVLENPYDDLKPRMTKEQRREEEKKQKEEAEKRKNEEEKKKKGKGKKNTALLSFGDEEGGEAEIVLKGPKSSHDLLKDDKRLSKQSIESNKKRKKDAAPEPSAPSKIEASAPSESTQSNGTSSKTRHATPPPVLQAKDRPHKTTSKPSVSSSSSLLGRDYLSQQRAKYAPSSKKDSYDALLSFQSRLRASDPSSSSKTPISTTAATADDDNEEEEEAREYGASDDDTDWQEHRLDAGGKPLLASGGGGDKVEDYEVLDPREHRSSDGKAKDEDRKREGKRGRDWVDDGRRYTSYSNHKDKDERRRGDAGERDREGRSSSYKSRSRDDGRRSDRYDSRSRDNDRNSSVRVDRRR